MRKIRGGKNNFVIFGMDNNCGKKMKAANFEPDTSLFPSSVTLNVVLT